METAACADVHKVLLGIAAKYVRILSGYYFSLLVYLFTCL